MNKHEKKKRILYILQLPPPVHGVSEINSLIVENPLVNSEFETELVELRFATDFQNLRTYGPSKIIAFIKILYSIRKKIRNFRPDVIYFSLFPFGIGFLRDFIYLLIIKRSQANIFLHLHNRGIDHASKSFFYRHLYSKAFSSLTIIHVAKTLLQSEFRFLKLQNCNLKYVNNTCKPFVKTTVQEKKDKPKLLFFSNLFAAKGVELAIEAMKDIVLIYPDACLQIGGPVLRKKFLKRLQRLIESSNLQNNVFLFGPAFGENKTILFETSDIFLFPSYFKEECLPLVILEAMQKGLAIIASDAGAISEIIDHGENGILIPQKNKHALSENIIELYTNKALRKKLGENARNKFHAKFGVDHFHQEIYSLIKNENSD